MLKLNVQSIFDSIDGEANGFDGAGQLTTFIRLKGCNLSCSYCFGIRKGRRDPKIILSSKPNKRLTQITVGDKLLTFDKDFNKVETEVTNVIEREVDSWYIVKIEGTTYFITEEHPFFTTRGLVKMMDLKVGDMILHSRFNDKLSFRVSGQKNPMKIPEVVEKAVKNRDNVAIGKSISKTIQRKKEEGTYVTPWFTFSEEEKKRLKETMSKAKIGNKNPNWKGGSKTPNYSNLKKLCSSGSLTICKICSLDKKLEVHHIDADKNNDELSNLTTICHSCHSKIHKKGYNFWLGKRTDGKALSIEPDFTMLQMNGFEVQKIKYIERTKIAPSIRPKPLKVYNLSCSPYNSYLIDYMWVHNCDTSYTQSVTPENWMTIPEIIEQVHFPKVTITGGEPGEQKEGIRELCRELLFKRIHTQRNDPMHQLSVSIETNGTYFIDTLGVPFIRVIMDYKLPSSGVEDQMNLEAFHLLGKDDMIKFVISDWKDYDRAIELIRMYPEWRAKKIFSPTLTTGTWITVPGNPKDIPTVGTDWARQLVERMLKDKVNANFSLQLHKILWPGTKEER